MPPLRLLPRPRPRKDWANTSAIGLWFALAAAIAATMLVGTLVVAELAANSPGPPSSSLLLDRVGTFAHVRYIFFHNMLVLGIHLGACYIGAIIGRPYKPMRSQRWQRWHRQLPTWMAKAALTYALFATSLSVGLQTFYLGHDLAALSATLEVAPARLLLLVLPHAIPELVGIFLPLALFIIAAYKGDLASLAHYIYQAALFSVPLVAGAAVIEVYLTPQLIASATASHPLFHFI